MRMTVALLCILVLCSLASCYAADIVTMPTANQLDKGGMYLSYYHVNLNFPPGAPASAEIQTIDLGLTAYLEMSLNRYDIDKVGASTIVNASLRLMNEVSGKPDIVIGGRNIGEDIVGGDPRSNKASWFMAAAKTLNPPVQGPPKLPIIRLHAGVGTEDYTVLGKSRHGGLFGGVQMLVTPQVGAVALYDATDFIACVTYMPKNTCLELKSGVIGDHWFVGLSYKR